MVASDLTVDKGEAVHPLATSVVNTRSCTVSLRHDQVSNSLSLAVSVSTTYARGGPACGVTGVMTPMAIEVTAARNTVESITRPSFMSVCV